MTDWDFPHEYVVYWQHGMLPFARSPEFIREQGQGDSMHVGYMIRRYIDAGASFLVEINGEMGTWDYHYPNLMEQTNPW